MSKENNPLTQELEFRGLVFQYTSDTLDEVTGSKKTLYLGVDPTADSLHVGNLLSFMTVRHFLEHGHKVVILVGGGTATIGDPSGKTAERVLMDDETIGKNAEKIRAQIHTVLGSGEFELVDNKDWLGDISVLNFLRDIGKHFTVNDMLRKESVKRRIEDPDSSISFTEFSYMLLQAYDFFILNEKFGCNLQLGGSDQWGNITAGVELIRKKKQAETYGLTTPLLLDKNTGRKFGKTESGTIWLDPEKTSPFNYYQFWYNIDDESASEYIKYYTLLSKTEIEEIISESKEKPEERMVQTRLAYESTVMIHGKEQADAVQNMSKALFKNDVETLSSKEKEMLKTTVPSMEIASEELINGLPLVDILVKSELASSKRDARTLIESNAIMIHGEKVTDPQEMMNAEKMSSNGITILRKGKRDILLLYVAGA